MADMKRTAACGIVIALSVKRKRQMRKRGRNRSIWTREWILKRPQQGAYHQLIQELQLTDQLSYKHFLRMDIESFEELLHAVSPLIQRQDTHMRQAITPGERLALTLRFLATGESYSSLQYIYRIPAQTIGKIIPDTCDAIVQALKHHIEVPKTESEWKAIANQFYTKWQFPHCIGALDGKHIIIQPPANTGSYFFNYKHTFSIVLMALVDADYKFIYIDTGCNGRVSDGGVFRNCTLYSALENGTLNIPQPSPIEESGTLVPYVIVADDAFPLKEYLQKPYSQNGLNKDKRIFNYRLSRARRIVENAFGILSNRFRVFMSPIRLMPEKVESIVFACCTLHNFLRSKQASRNVYTPPGTFDSEDTDTHTLISGNWRAGQEPGGLLHLRKQGSNNYTANAKNIREYLCDYFNSENGAVPWQEYMI